MMNWLWIQNEGLPSSAKVGGKPFGRFTLVEFAFGVSGILNLAKVLNVVDALDMHVSCKVGFSLPSLDQPRAGRLKPTLRDDEPSRRIADVGTDP